MKNIKHKFTFLGYIILLILLFCCCSSSSQQNNNPTIVFSFVPPFGSMENLKGKTENINSTDYNVAVYIKVAEQWWTKPSSNNPLTKINNDGTWECDITTGGIDEQATEIAAYLISKNYNPPIMTGSASLPTELEKNSEANVNKIREVNYRNINFSGYNWTVKFSNMPAGPGPNYFSDSVNYAFIDDSGFVHLKIKENNGKWQCSEIICSENFGYGTYIFYLSSRIDIINENAVLGLFTWSDAADYHHREIDIELSKWSDPNNQNSQYVVQPWDNPANMHRFNTTLTNVESTHIFTWSKDSIRFMSFYGHHASPPDNSYVINEWTYKGQDIPVPGNENIRMNLWLFNGNKPSDNKEVEIIIKKFEFIK